MKSFMSINLYIFCLVFMLTLLNFIIFSFNTYGSLKPTRFPKPAQRSKSEFVGFIINTTGCKIPDIISSLTYYNKYFKLIESIECEDVRSPLFESNLTSVFINETALPMYGFANIKLIKCCYMWLKRLPTGRAGLKPPDESVIFQSECVFFDLSYRSPYEYLKVHCFEMKDSPKSNVALASKIDKMKPFYTDFFYFVYPTKQIMQFGPSGSNYGKVNVLIVGLDSTSRLNFHRQMPRTSQLLQDLKAVEFFGFNKIGDNTFPNVLALLTGNSSEEITKTCLKASSTDKVFDKCHFIWDDYKTKGYATAFIEDAITTGLFNYKPDRKGFLEQPTDFYWNNFYRAAVKEIGNKVTVTQPYCFGTRKIHEVMLEYIIRFATVMDINKQPYFGHFWQSLLCHDNVNQPQNGDDTYAEFLTTLNDSGLLKNTIMFFMSDHGFRFGAVRRTYQGMLEDRLPFVFVKLPDWMSQSYPHLQDNLKLNSRRLITMYDLYETFQQLLKPSSLRTSNWNTSVRRGYSILSPIIENRNCNDADIPNQWCVCQVSTPVRPHDVVVLSLAEFIISHINDDILKDFPACERLSLDDVIYARKAHTGEQVEVKEGFFKEIYTIGLRVSPSNALFEGTVIRSTDGAESHSVTLSDTISRLQLFKNDSLCITNHFAQMYCFCSDLLLI